MLHHNSPLHTSPLRGPMRESYLNGLGWPLWGFRSPSANVPLIIPGLVTTKGTPSILLRLKAVSRYVI